MKPLKVSWQSVEGLCGKLAKRVSSFKPDVIVGISRGGLVPLRLLSDLLDNQNVAVMKIEFYKSINVTHDFPRITQPLTVDVRGKRVLIVDDVADTGRSLLVAKEHIKIAGAKDLKIATLHYKPHSLFKPDYFVETTDKWLVYPWEKKEFLKNLKKRK